MAENRWDAVVVGSGLGGAMGDTPYIGLLVACGLKPRTLLALSVRCGALASTPETG